MINLESVEQIKGIYDNEKIDWDRYTIEIRSPFSLKEYSIIVDFLKEEITGECISYGSWFDIKETDCLELLEIILKENKMNVTNTSNAEKEDVEKYSIKEGSFESITAYSISIDFKNESVSGACFRNSFFDHMIDTKKCIELLEDIKKYYSPERDFSSVLENNTL